MYGVRECFHTHHLSQHYIQYTAFIFIAHLISFTIKKPRNYICKTLFFYASPLNYWYIFYKVFQYHFRQSSTHFFHKKPWNVDTFLPQLIAFYRHPISFNCCTYPSMSFLYASASCMSFSAIHSSTSINLLAILMASHVACSLFWYHFRRHFRSPHIYFCFICFIYF